MKGKLLAVTRLLGGSFTPFLEPFWGSEEWEAIREWLAGTSFADARAELEDEIIASCNGRDWRVRLTNLGRSALYLGLKALPIETGSEVAIPSYSCKGIVDAVVRAGLHPLLIDIDDDFSLGYESLTATASAATRAVVVPHLAGRWARDLVRIVEWAHKRGVFVIEDVAQAFGLRRRDGTLAGTVGDIAIYSSGLGKALFGPGGGWLISRRIDLERVAASEPLQDENRPDVARRLRSFIRKFARRPRARGSQIIWDALASRLRAVMPGALNRDVEREDFPVLAIADIEARLALMQARKIDTIVGLRRQNAQRWRKLLAPLDPEKLRFLEGDDNIASKMVVWFEGPGAREASRGVARALWNGGVEVEPLYTPLHLRPPFDRARRSSMLVTDARWQSVFSVPARPNLVSRDWERIESALSQITPRVGPEAA